MTQDASLNYKGVFDTHLEFGSRPALLLIDFVQAYFDPDSPLYADVEDELAQALRLRDMARTIGIPTIYTNVVYHSNMMNAGRFYEKTKPLEVFKSGSPFGHWPEGLSPSVDELVISKQYPSAFFGTSLSSTLTAQNIDCVIITGLTTSGCVRATCIDACSHGFTAFVIKDACGDRHPAPHNANLFDMQAKYGEVITTSQCIELLFKFENT